jgi:hypothetical protein
MHSFCTIVVYNSGTILQALSKIKFGIAEWGYDQKTVLCVFARFYHTLMMQRLKFLLHLTQPIYFGVKKLCFLNQPFMLLV